MCQMFSQNRLKLKLSELYYIALIIFVVDTNLRYSYFYGIWTNSDNIILTIMKVFRYFSYIVCIARIISITRFSKKHFLFLFILFSVGMLAATTGPEKTTIFQCLLFGAAIDSDFDKVVKIFLTIQGFFLVINILLSISGFFDVIYVYDLGRLRYLLGYGWANRASYCWLFLCLEYIYLKRFRINAVFLLLMVTVATVLYHFTQTNFPYIITICIFLCSAIKMISNYSRRLVPWRKNSKEKSKLYIFLFICLVLIGFLLPYFYNSENNIMHGFNLLLNSRLSLGKRAYDLYGIGLFGHKVQWIGSSSILYGQANLSDYFVVDCDYLRLTIQYGVPYIMLIIFFYSLGLRRSCQLNQFSISFCILVIGFTCIFEPRLVDFGFNPFIFYSLCNFSFEKKILQGI